MFEQRLTLFHCKQLLSPALENEKAHFSVSRIKKEFQAHDVAVEIFGSWSTVDERRLVANTVKHAEGDSSERLHIRLPDLFRDPRLQDFGTSELTGASNQRIFLPRWEDLFLSIEEIHRYRDAIVKFWNDLGEAISSCSTRLS